MAKKEIYFESRSFDKQVDKISPCLIINMNMNPRTCPNLQAQVFLSPFF